MRLITAAGLIGSLALTALPAPAYAGTVSASASRGSFCLYKDTNYGGKKYCITPPAKGKTKWDYNLKDNYWPGTKQSVDNSASSMKNTTPCWITLRDKFGGKEYLVKPGPHSVDSTFKNNGFNDKASGWYAYNCPK